MYKEEDSRTGMLIASKLGWHADAFGRDGCTRIGRLLVGAEGRCAPHGFLNICQTSRAYEIRGTSLLHLFALYCVVLVVFALSCFFYVQVFWT